MGGASSWFGGRIAAGVLGGYLLVGGALVGLVGVPSQLGRAGAPQDLAGAPQGLASSNTVVGRIGQGCDAVLPRPGWVGSWSASQVPASPADPVSEAGFHDQTLRELVHLSLGGTAIQVTLSNRFGHTPLVVPDARVAISGPAGSIAASSQRRFDFSGQTSVVIPPGAQATSDAVPLAVPDQANVAVSIYIAGTTGPTTWEPGAFTTGYVSRTGDHSAEATAASYPAQVTAWYFLSGVNVFSRVQVGSVLAFGDSITSGDNSGLNLDATWPEDLFRRVEAGLAPGHRVAVLDAGIDANRLLAASLYGSSGEGRFAVDALAQLGVRTVIFTEGINDIRLGDRPGADPALTPAELIAGMRAVIAQAHARGLAIIGGTLIPYGGDTGFWTPEGEAVRQAVNHWIRTSRAFDGVADFDAAVRDPSDPVRMLPAYGGPLHPNDAGYRAMAATVPLGLLCGV